MNKEELVINNQQLDNASARHATAPAPAGAAHASNDVAGGYPRSPGGANQLAADQNMDDDTGLSNTVNAPAVDERGRQSEQSNVGRRSDMTPD